MSVFFVGQGPRFVPGVYMCHGRSVGSRFVGDKRDLPPLMTESLFHGYINTYGLGLMSLSPIIWN